MPNEDLKSAAAALGRAGGLANTEAQRLARQENARKMKPKGWPKGKRRKQVDIPSSL